MATTTTTRRGRKTGTAAAARREAAQTAKNALLEQLEQFEAAGDHDAATLARIAHFSIRYSLRNAMLIAMQAPQATEVNAYRAWQALGRQVRKGEQGIYILAPAGQSGGEQPEESADTPTGGDGKTERVRKFFRMVAVFDITQTDPIAAATAA